MKYLVGFITVHILAGMQVGYVLACMNQLDDTMQAKFAWPKNLVTTYRAVTGSCGIFGLAIGALAAGRLMAIGRKPTMLIASVIGIFGVLIEMIENFPAIIIGRIIYGFSSGIYSVCVGRYIEETVPH